jgi:ferric iron reductase protein FhuF
MSHINETSIDSPLATTLARVGALDHYLRAERIDGLGDGWWSATELVASDGEKLDAALHHTLKSYPTAPDDRHIAASFFLGWYTWAMPAAATASYLLEGRVPDLDPANIALRFIEAGDDEESSFGIAFLSDRMAVLPDDAAAGASNVIVLGDRAELREWLRQSLEAHMTPLIEAIYARTRFGRRAQWNLVADNCASLFLLVGEKTDALDAACAEGLTFVGAPGSPMARSKTGYFTLQANGRCETFRKRGGCCLYYKLPGGQNCSTCSLISEAERDRRLLAWMTESACARETTA